MTERFIDVVIPIHQDNRPIERAVDSVVTSAPSGTRALVVCHNMETENIERRLAQFDADAVEVLKLADGIPSPAGPFNVGLDAAQARYVAILGSDDHLEPGALQAWADMAEHTHAAAVIAKLRYDFGTLKRTPPTRWGRRTTGLKLAADRLAYRTAPLGLMRRTVLNEQELRFTPDMPNGKDLEFGLKLWSNGNVVYARDAPAYVIGTDAVQRVTMTPRPVHDALKCCLHTIATPWFTQLTTDEQVAIVVKLLRIHVFAAVDNRPELSMWSAAERESFAEATKTILGAAPTARRHLSLVERRLLRGILDPAADTTELLRLAGRRARHGQWDTVLTPDLRGLLSAQGPLRLMASSVLMR